MDMNLLTDGLEPQAVPQKFKDPQSGGFNVKALLDSYTALERKMSAQQPTIPKSAQEYCITCAHGLFEPDMQVNQRLHNKGLSQEQVQEVYDLAAEKMVPMILELASDFQADREVEKLIAHFGGEEKWREVSRQLLAFGQKSLPADVLDNLSSSYEGVLALYRMMQNQGPSMMTNKKEAGAVAQGADMNALKSMMRDPKYWRDKDPSTVAQVTEGFQNLYKNQ